MVWHEVYLDRAAAKCDGEWSALLLQCQYNYGVKKPVSKPDVTRVKNEDKRFDVCESASQMMHLGGPLIWIQLDIIASMAVDMSQESLKIGQRSEDINHMQN